MMDFKEKAALWIHDHFSSILLILGTATGSAGINLIKVHEWLAVILQLTGLCSFVIYFLMNYKKAWSELKNIFGK